MTLVGYGGGMGDPITARAFLVTSEGEILFQGAGYKNAEFDELPSKQLVTLERTSAGRLSRRCKNLSGRIPLISLYAPARVSFFSIRAYLTVGTTRQGAARQRNRNKHMLVKATIDF
jgi:hypothetical protein